MSRIWTIGHSSRSIESFVYDLQSFAIDVAVDVRSYPGSAYCPWFGKEKLALVLESKDIEYLHFQVLGGRRSRDVSVDQSLNAAWLNVSFRNYADYTLTSDYQLGLFDLVALAAHKRVAFFCAEALPWRCHRLLISNSLTAGGWDVQHISPEQPNSTTHQLGMWGAPPRVDFAVGATLGNVVTYPVG